MESAAFFFGVEVFLNGLMAGGFLEVGAAPTRLPGRVSVGTLDTSNRARFSRNG